jgi:hypothetical protein
MNELRTQLDAALAALGIATSAYIDTIASGVVIKPVHIQQLRDRMK